MTNNTYKFLNGGSPYYYIYVVFGRKPQKKYLKIFLPKKLYQGI